jgi:hypothetical protein
MQRVGHGANGTVPPACALVILSCEDLLRLTGVPFVAVLLRTTRGRIAYGTTDFRARSAYEGKLPPRGVTSMTVFE